MKSLLFLLTPKASTSYLFDDDSLRQALEKMEYHRYSLIPVIDNQGKYVRSVSEGDILYAMKSLNCTFENMNHYGLSEAKSSRDIKPVRIDATLEELLKLIISQNYVPVIDDKGIYIGLVTRKAVMHELFEQQGIRI